MLCILWEFRAQLAAPMDRRNLDSRLEGLSRWVSAAEVSDIAPLRMFVTSLRTTRDTCFKTDFPLHLAVLKARLSHQTAAHLRRAFCESKSQGI